MEQSRLLRLCDPGLCDAAGHRHRVWPLLRAPSRCCGRQVLLNLLIAMLSNTFEKNDKDAQQSYKLHRARMLVCIDQSMTAAQRLAPDKVFWQTSPAEPQKR